MENKFKKAVIVTLAVLYCISPDLIPGPIDDVVLLAMALGA